MKGRESQTVTLSRQSILLVAGVGVGLLTLTYVLGVQVGKQAVGLRRPMDRAADEDLKELPESLADQLKYFENLDRPPDKRTVKPEGETGKTDAPKPEAGKPEAGKPEPKKPDAKAEPKKTDPPKAEPKKSEAPKPEPKQPEGAKPEPKKPDAAGVEPKKSEAATGQKWTLQLVSTSDQAEVDRLVAKASAAGFGTRVVKANGQLKLRITQADTYEKISQVAGRLKEAGFKPFPVKAD